MTAVYACPRWAAYLESYDYQQIKRLSLMLPAIAVILWCNLLAVLTNGYLKILSIDAPAKRSTARYVLGLTAVVTLGLASWQTAEVVREGYKVSERLEEAKRPWSSGGMGLPSQRSKGARPNQNLP